MTTEDTGTERHAGLVRRIRKQAVDWAARRFGVSGEALRNLRSFSALAGPGAGGFPSELLPLGASMWSGYFITPFAQQQMEGWVLPYWLRMQTSPGSGSFVPHGHVYLKSNITHRNWTGVGICGSPHEGTVDPRGLVTPWPYSPSVDVWLKAGGELVCPSELESVDQELIDDLPFVRTRFGGLGLGCELVTFVAELDGSPVVLSRITVTNEGPDRSNAQAAISVRPYNTESISAINNLQWLPGDSCFVADGDVIAYLPEAPDSVMLSDYAHGDVAQQLRGERKAPPGPAASLDEPFGLATGAATYNLALEPGSFREMVFACPLSPGTRPSFLRMLPEDGAILRAGEALAAQQVAWAGVAGEGMRVKVPDERYQKAFDIDKTWLLLMYDGDKITPGVSQYHMMWFRDAAYLVPALERMGQAEKARTILDTYSGRQDAEGFYRSHNGEWDSQGQAMWTLVNHYRMTGDTDFLKTNYPALMKAARWLDCRRQTMLPEGNPCHGLLPPGISAEHFGINDCYYWDDLWAVAGLRSTALAARDLGMDGDSSYLESLAEELMSAMRASWHLAAGRLGREVLPIAPGRDIDAAAAGMLAAVYPLDVLPPEDPAMAATVRELVERCFYMDTHYHGMMHCGLNPYLSMHAAQYFLRRRDPYALKIFESLWSMATSTYTFPEAINPLTWGGAYGDGHDGWSACDIFHFVRNLMLMEENDALCLLPLAPGGWLEAGNTIEVAGAPTYFGTVGYRLDCGGDSAELILSTDWRSEPSSVRLGMPFTVKGCTVDGKKVKTASGPGEITLPAGAEKAVIDFER